MFMGRIAFIAAVLAGVIAMLSTPAHPSWDFSLAGANNSWYYGHYTQMGGNGFFGPYDVDATAGAPFAALNGWVGNTEDINAFVSGSNAVVSQFNLTTDAGFGNEWVRLTGRYKIQPYSSNTAEGAYVTISPAQLALWAIELRSPIVRIIYGKQDFKKGFGLQFDHSRSAEYLILERGLRVPNVLGRLIMAGLLPRSAMNWFSPSRWSRYNPKRAAEEKERTKEGVKERAMYSNMQDPSEHFDLTEGLEWDDMPAYKEKSPYADSFPADDDPYAWAVYEPGTLDIGFGFYPWNLGGNVGFNANDVGSSQTGNYLGYLRYYSTELSFGLGCLRQTTHLGPELQKTVLGRDNTRTTESYLTEGWAFLHYANSRFSLKSELAWFNQVTRYHGTITEQIITTGAPVADPGLVGAGSAFASDYVESWRFMAETAVTLGPAGVRVFFSWMPGPDRRQGILIDRQPGIRCPSSTPTALYTRPGSDGTDQSAVGLQNPYSMFLGPYFGGGVKAQNYIDDATVLAFGVDYALAANLFMDTTILFARRNSHGYGWGYISPNTAKFGDVLYQIRGVYGDAPPAIPDNDLGWEVAGGFTWELMDGWSVGGRVGYWKPGRWFNYACIDKSRTGWNTPTVGNFWGINPDRDIDPMMGFEIRFSGSY